jgi:hypothetical protein
VKEGRQGPGLRSTRSGPEGDARRVVVRAGWRGPGGWRRHALTGMFSPAPQDGWSPLHWASLNGHLEVVEALLAKGADVEAKTNVSIARAVHARIGVGLCACSVYIGERACVCAIGSVRECMHSCVRASVCVRADGGADRDARLRRRTDGRRSATPLDRATWRWLRRCWQRAPTWRRRRM